MKMTQDFDERAQMLKWVLEKMNIDEWESTKDDTESRRSEVAVVCLTRHVLLHWEMAVSCVWNLEHS